MRSGAEAFDHVIQGMLADLRSERASLRLNMQAPRRFGREPVLDEVRAGILGRIAALRAGVRCIIRLKREGAFRWS